MISAEQVSSIIKTMLDVDLTEAEISEVLPKLERYLERESRCSAG